MVQKALTVALAAVTSGCVTRLESPRLDPSRAAVTLSWQTNRAGSRVTDQAVPVAVPSLTLSWQYPTIPDILFNVWHRTNLAAGTWERVGTVTGKTFQITADLLCEFFTVTASNTVSGLESDLP